MLCANGGSPQRTMVEMGRMGQKLRIPNKVSRDTRRLQQIRLKQGRNVQVNKKVHFCHLVQSQISLLRLIAQHQMRQQILQLTEVERMMRMMFMAVVVISAHIVAMASHLSFIDQPQVATAVMVMMRHKGMQQNDRHSETHHHRSRQRPENMPIVPTIHQEKYLYITCKDTQKSVKFTLLS